MLDWIIFFTMLVVAFFWGGHVERKHYVSIRAREDALPFIPVVQYERNNFPYAVESVTLVQGSTVIGADYFKAVLAGLVSFFGGNIAALESVLDRGRRESLLRLKQQAAGADFLANLRYETTEISGSSSRGALPKVEFFAYATAITLKKDAI